MLCKHFIQIAKIQFFKLNFFYIVAKVNVSIKADLSFKQGFRRLKSKFYMT